jgi:D-amino-acid oxidase
LSDSPSCLRAVLIVIDIVNVLHSAGVTGLTSALFLAEAGYTVTVLAAHVPGDESIEYTSPWYDTYHSLDHNDLQLTRSRAGAHWLPFSRAHEPMIRDWDLQTYDYWLDMIRREEAEGKSPVSESGIKVYPILSSTSQQINPS